MYDSDISYNLYAMFNGITSFLNENLSICVALGIFQELWRYYYASEIILGLGSANGRRPFYVTPSLIGIVHTQNDPCAFPTCFGVWRDQSCSDLLSSDLSLRRHDHGGTTEEGNCSYLLPLSHRDDMKTLSAWFAICERNPIVRSFGAIFDINLNNQQSSWVSLATELFVQQLVQDYINGNSKAHC